MKINKLPFIRWYASDFLAGTRGMKASEVGIYTILLNLMYEQCEPLPLDIDYLSSQCGCRKPAFLKSLEKLKSRNKIILVDGCLWNERVQKEFTFRAKKSQIATQNINERWKKHNKINGDEIQTYNSGNTEKILYQKPETINHKDIKDIDKSISKKPLAKKGCRIDEKFKDGDQIPDDYLAAATKKGLGRERACSEFERFINYWTAASGSYAIKRDWLATWRNRVSIVVERDGNKNTNRNGQSKPANASPIDAATEIIDEGLSL